MKHVGRARSSATQRSHEAVFGAAGLNDFVSLPIYESTLSYNPRLLGPLGDIVVGLASHFGDKKTYPNSRMHLAPLPSDQRTNRLTYIVAWGKNVDRLPHPRQERLPEYFGRAAMLAMRVRSNRVYIKPVMDGYGIVGRIGINILGGVEMGVYMNDKTGNVAEKWYPDLYDIGLVTQDIVEGLSQGSPLRFRSGIRYIPRNGYIENEFLQGDQQKAVPHTA